MNSVNIEDYRFRKDISVLYDELSEKRWINVTVVVHEDPGKLREFQKAFNYSIMERTNESYWK